MSSVQAKSVISMVGIALAGVSLFYWIPPTKDPSTFKEQLHQDQGTLNVHVAESKRKQEQVLAAIQHHAGLSPKNK